MRTYILGSLPDCRRYFPAAGSGHIFREPLSFITREMIADVYDSELRGRKDLTVCFTGHRIIPQNEHQALSDRLDAVLEELYRRGFRDFISGAALGFDVLCAERVFALRRRHPDVLLRLAIPCSSQSDRWSESDCIRYERMLYNADSTHVLSREYYSGCMQVRNRFMVDRSTFCLCYLTHNRGGTMSTVAYAMEVDCPVLNLAMEDACEAFVRGG